MHRDEHDGINKLLSEQLRELIESSGVSRYKLARAIDVDESGLSKFMRRQRGLSLAAVDRLGQYFDLEIRPRMEGPNTKGK